MSDQTTVSILTGKSGGFGQQSAGPLTIKPSAKVSILTGKSGGFGRMKKVFDTVLSIAIIVFQS